MSWTWRYEFKRGIWVLITAICLGLLIGQIAWTLCIAAMLYNLWLFYQLHRIKFWLNSDSNSTPPYCSGIVGEIFDSLYRLQRRNTKANMKLQDLVNRVQESTAALKDSVITTTASGNLEWWNLSSEKLLGLRSPDDVGQKATNLIRSPEFKLYFEGEDYDEPIEIPSPINPKITLQIQISSIRDGNRLLMIRNITQLKQLEIMRRDFVGNVSHELRTPLTVIRGYLETFLDIDSDLPPRLIRALKQMQTQATRMESMVSDLLLLSRLETTQIDQRQDTVDIGKMLSVIHQDAETLGKNHNHRITLEADSNLLVIGQEPELRSAFSNLIYNAVKYTPPEGEIHIEWRSDAEGAYLSVQDNGIGIEQKHIPRLTERFYRADFGRTTDTGGTGLGLAIVKHVLLRHDANLKIESELGRGSTFICYFPIHRTAQAIQSLSSKYNPPESKSTMI